MGRLDEVDLNASIDKKEGEKQLKRAQERMTQLRLTLGGQLGDNRLGPPVLIVFEGWDASGKGGAIKRLVAQMDPRHVRVKQFAAPTHDEKRHHFLWRFWPALPGWGGMAIFDRSWYGRVLVERVEEFATREQWLRAYDEIAKWSNVMKAAGIAGKGPASVTRSSCSESSWRPPLSTFYSCLQRQTITSLPS